MLQFHLFFTLFTTNKAMFPNPFSLFKSRISIFEYRIKISFYLSQNSTIFYICTEIKNEILTFFKIDILLISANILQLSVLRLTLRLPTSKIKESYLSIHSNMFLIFFSAHVSKLMNVCFYKRKLGIIIYHTSFCIQH